MMSDFCSITVLLPPSPPVMHLNGVVQDSAPVTGDTAVYWMFYESSLTWKFTLQYRKISLCDHRTMLLTVPTVNAWDTFLVCVGAAWFSAGAVKTSLTLYWLKAWKVVCVCVFSDSLDSRLQWLAALPHKQKALSFNACSGFSLQSFMLFLWTQIASACSRANASAAASFEIK